MRSHAAALTRECQISLRTSPMVPGLHNQRGGKLGFDRNWETLGNFGFPWFSLVFLAFPKFPKVSQRFPPAPFAAKSWKCRVGSDQLAWRRSLARDWSTPHPIIRLWVVKGFLTEARGRNSADWQCSLLCQLQFHLARTCCRGARCLRALPRALFRHLPALPPIPGPHTQRTHLLWDLMFFSDTQENRRKPVRAPRISH